MRHLYPAARSAVRAIAATTMLVAMLVAVPSATRSSETAGGSSYPNVILVTIDTLRADHVSGYGYSRPTTPNLDALMARGVRFDTARTVEPLTNPALTSLITSSHPHRHGGSRNGLRVRGGLASLPKVLQAHGYRTAAFVGNWTLRDKLSGLAEHFELYEEVLTRNRWFGMIRREATAEDITEGALTWLADHQRRRPGQPFLLWVHYVEPHAPYRLHDDLIEPLGLVKGKLTDLDRYDTEIAYADRSVGHLLAGLEGHSAPRNTLIVFAADHGESLGEHKYWGHGRNLYEPGLRVPLSVTWEGRIAPGHVEAPAVILDVAPTVLGLAGFPIPGDFQGFDWTPVLGGAAPPLTRVTHYQAHRGAVISSHDSDLRRQAGLLEVGLIRGTRKELLRLDRSRREVFDLAADPGEIAPLSSDRSPPGEALLNWLHVVQAGLGAADAETVPEELDPESAEKMRSLGYVD